MNTIEIAQDYSRQFSDLMMYFDWLLIDSLAEALYASRRDRSKVFLCDNSGSAANSVHLANDISYDEIYAHQLKVFAKKDDVLIVLSGSGNSPIILRAIEVGSEIGMKTFAILGFDGGKAKAPARHPIRFVLDDMQIVEDCQMVVGHILMKTLKENLA